MKRTMFAFVLAFALVGEAWAVPPGELAARARTAEAQGDTATAARALEELLAAGINSTDVLYNLGTVYARSERFGEAIWCFERVTLRSPGHLAARKNLRATRVRLARRDAARTGRAVVETPPSLSVQMGELLPYGYAVPLAVLAQIAVISAWMVRRKTRTEVARVGATIATVFALCVFAFSAAVVTARRARPPSAIVLHGGLRALQTPRVDGIPEGTVREGERITLTRREGEYARIQTVSGTTGWLALRDLGILED
jgi:hypothetical protein